ncbi:MAG: helix-turn-helix domain-containing protein [Cyanobacteria bacterium P01_F01_bin.150]
MRYNYRIYPNEKQKGKIAQTFGCARIVWNDSLALIKDLEKGET